MEMKSIVFLACAGIAALGLAARPNVTVTSMRDASGTLQVQYTVDAPAVVTFDVLTNGVPIGGEWTATGVKGDVFRRVAAGAHGFQWKAYHEGLEEFRLDGATAKVRVKAWALDAPPDYVVFDLQDGASATYYENAGQIAGGVTNDVYKTTKLVMRKIPAAYETFRMGTPYSENGRQSNEAATLVTLTNDYYLGVYPLTYAHYAYGTGTDSTSRTPLRGGFYGVRGGDNGTKAWPEDGHAVDKDTCVIYMLREGTGLPFDLPTRAQWEFACRAGEKAALYTGGELTVTDAAADEALDDIAWYGYNTPRSGDSFQIPEVGQKQPNAWGLYDMLGLVWEWVLDRDWSLPGGTLVEPKGAASGDNRQRCGGGYDSPPYRCRSASVLYNRPTYSNDGASGVNGICNNNQGLRLWLPATAER